MTLDLTVEPGQPVELTLATPAAIGLTLDAEAPVSLTLAVPVPTVLTLATPQPTTLIVGDVGIAGPQGDPGPAGPAGSGSVETLIAGQTVSGHRVVATQPDGTVLYASNAHLGDATRQLWITLGAAIAGDTVQCQAFGRVTEPGWSWADTPIFLGDNGVLTQTPPSLPSAAFFLQVAASDGPTALMFNPRTPFQL